MTSLLTHDENANQYDPFLVTESNTLKKKSNRTIVDSIIHKKKIFTFLKKKYVYFFKGEIRVLNRVLL